VLDSLKSKITATLEDEDSLLWAVAFVGVCVLVGLGKVKPETLEYLLFAVIGRSSKGAK
jgi:hypothetical protein